MNRGIVSIVACTANFGAEATSQLLGRTQRGLPGELPCGSLGLH